MNERWVCKRCFADNDATTGACARCGLMRGAESSEADRAAWVAQVGAPAAAPAPGWRKWARFWWIPAIAIAIGVGYFTTARRGDDGSVTGGGQLSAGDLRAGDCFDFRSEDAEAEEISDVHAVPCTEAHDFEVYRVADHTATAYPAQAEWQSVYVEHCVAAFDSYVGAPYETSAIYASMMTPTFEAWSEGDHEIVCYLYEPVGTSETEVLRLTESLRGAAR